jgi:dephospho-CoA kinase
MKTLKGDARSLLVGVTGGIATGKSVVASMLEEMGAPMIDFDLLARRVVEPDKPAWRDIVAYFGEQALKEDQTLDRESVAKIVFADREKRKMLESFTHPRIREEFVAEVRAIRQKDPNAIIQAVVPLLIESNLQSVFDHLVVVHAPADVQIVRLMERDDLTREGVEARLRAQIPIDEKAGHADTVIDNSGSLENTHRQVEELWERLRELRAGNLSDDPQIR